MPTYASVDGKVLSSGTGIRVRVTATPLTRDQVITFPADDFIDWGPVVGVSNPATGRLETPMLIPISGPAAGVSWRFLFEPLDKKPGVTLRPWSRVYEITADTRLDDLVETEAITVTPEVITTVSEYATEAEAARDEAVAAKAAAEAVGATNDTIIAGRVNDPASATKGALTATIASATKVIPVTNYLLAGETLPNNGTLDASPLIQRGLDAIRAMGAAETHGVRYLLGLPAGKWRLNTTLNPCSNTAQQVAKRMGIVGAGSGQTILLPYGDASGIEPWMDFTANPRTTARSVECTYSGFTIDCTNATHPDPTEASFKGFKGSGWVDCFFKDIIVQNSPATAFGNDYPVRTIFQDCHVRTTGEGINGTISNPTPLSAAKSKSGFGLGFGVLANESVTFINCTATDCHRCGFFFETQQPYGTLRGAVISMIGCRSWANKIGVADVGTSGVHATNCDFTDNTYAGVYTGVSPFSSTQSGRDGTIEGCRILRNGVGIYSIGDSTSNHTWTTDLPLMPVLGGYRILDNRIEANTGQGILATWFKTIEAGGFTVRGNQFVRNGAAGIRMIVADDPLRDLAIENNYFDGNTGAAMQLLVPMNAPKITGNTFANSNGTNTQTRGIVMHPAEPVTAPMITSNTFRQITTPMRYVSRLDQTYVGSGGSGNRTLDGTTDPATASRLYREAFYGAAATNTAWPVGGDGWNEAATSAPTWTRDSTGIRTTGGTAGNRSMKYRDLGSSGAYVEAAIGGTTSASTFSQHVGVALGMQTGSSTAVILGVNGSASTSGISSFYALWKIVSGTRTLLWESTVPLNERHSVGLGRVAGSTMTDVFIDGELLNSIDIPDVAASQYGGLYSTYLSGGVRRVTEFRAMTYTG